jgi:hypothetical protein
VKVLDSVVIEQEGDWNLNMDDIGVPTASKNDQKRGLIPPTAILHRAFLVLVFIGFQTTGEI